MTGTTPTCAYVAGHRKGYDKECWYCVDDRKHTRIRLLALPYSAAKYGVRVDWSRLSKQLVFYWWTPKFIHSTRFREAPWHYDRNEP